MFLEFACCLVCLLIGGFELFRVVSFEVITFVDRVSVVRAVLICHLYWFACVCVCCILAELVCLYLWCLFDVFFDLLL